MSVFKRGKVYWYNFVWDGKKIQESTRQGNQRIAERMEAAHKTRLALGEVGIREKKRVPTLADFKERFIGAIEVRCAEKPRTIAFYKEKFQRLLDHNPLASAKLNEIDEAMIDAFVQERRKTVSPATVNRALATLRRCLRLAYRWRVIDRLPQITLLNGERNRDFVLSHDAEPKYLAACPQPLHDVALLILDTGLRLGEALALDWKDVQLEPAKGSKYGYIRVRAGKSRNAKRNLSLTGRVREVLIARAATDGDALVFGGFQVTSIDHQHQKVREAVKDDADKRIFPDDFVIHSLRHTMLTRLGESGTDAFTIMRIAGHSSVTVSQRYVHPTPEAMEKAFERLEDLNSAKSAAKADKMTKANAA